MLFNLLVTKIDVLFFNLKKFLDNNSSAVFTDGVYGGILLDKEGKFVKYFSYEDDNLGVTEKNLKPFSPYNYIMFTEFCVKSRIGILCLTSGDILLIKNKNHFL